MRLALTTLIGIVVISVLPAPVWAQANAGQTIATFGAGVAVGSIFSGLATPATRAADEICKGDPADQYPTDANKNGVIGVIGKPCFDLTAGFKTIGVCTAVLKCSARTSTSLGGISSGVGLSQVVGILGQLAGLLLKPSSGASAPAASPTATGGCPSGTYITSVVSSDPCAVYVPAVISTGTTSLNANTSSDLLNALYGTDTSLDTPATNTTNTPAVSTNDILGQLSGDTSDSLQAQVVSQSSSTTLNPVAGNVFAQSANLLPGLTGDIALLGNGATFVANNRDQASNSAVAGFYGGDTTLGTQPTGLVASWCQSRPWASNFLSVVIPPTFFDGLCTLRGYTVGAPPTPTGNGQSQVTITQSPIQPVQTTTSTSAASPIGNNPPVVDIWASPKTVAIGARTSIFWTSSGAASCTVTSPDGSFSQHSLTGGASTVAITTETIFTISCIAPDGSHATKDVTVRLAI